MEKRVKIFLEDCCIDLEDNINNFLEESSGKLHDVKFTHSFEFCSDTNDVLESFSALLIYTPEEV